jgi:hypothetical protein
MRNFTRNNFFVVSNVILVSLALTGCSSESSPNESSKISKVDSKTQKMIDNCETLNEVIIPFSEAYYAGDYEGATEALMFRAGSLATITQTEKENKLITDIVSQIDSVRSLMQSGQYDDNSILLDFLIPITVYNTFCFSLNFPE